ncbi:hypothetical protein JCM19039_3422 [Geomicrobium sp. JCM 19039]|nr:hypothetical protein JCM19039_3422 [Geomicrobium sp. JCM 19039]
MDWKQNEGKRASMGDSVSNPSALEAKHAITGKLNVHPCESPRNTLTMGFGIESRGKIVQIPP